MNAEKRPVDAQSSCPRFRHGFWSLDEEPAVCENCAFFDEGFCADPESAKDSAAEN